MELQTKSSVADYLQKHQLKEILEKALQVVVTAQPEDPISRLISELKANRARSGGPIIASAKYDPGLMDIFDAHALEMTKFGHEEMPNLVVVTNDPAGAYPVVSTYSDHPAVTELMQMGPSWQLGDRKRNYCLLVEDMQKEYDAYTDYVLPNAEVLLAKFRELKLPVVWTNWNRKQDDGHYCAIDRFYGPRGVGPQANPCYLYDPSGNLTTDKLAPQTEEERSRLVLSYHLSKFADLDASGDEILFPMLQAWGVDTLVVLGAWTDDCIAATCFETVDRYGLDCVLVKDAVATATIHGGKMVECLSAAVAKACTAAEIAAHLSENPQLVDSPKAPLVGSVYRSKPSRGEATKYG